MTRMRNRLSFSFEPNDIENPYFTFELAEKLGKTVHELLTGSPAPLSIKEHRMWLWFWSERAKREKEAEKKADRKSKGGGGGGDDNEVTAKTLGRGRGTVEQ